MRSARRTTLRRRIGSAVVLGFTAALLTGCQGVPAKSERAQRAQLEVVRKAYAPRSPAALTLGPHSGLSEYLLEAMRGQPRVEAAYHDYVAAVERITLERSLPDPRMAFELDIQDVVMTLMPGLMTEVPWLKKLRLRAEAASEESRAKYFAFELAVLQAAFEVKGPYYRLFFLTQRLRILEETLQLLAELEEMARAQNESGRVTLQDVLRAQIEQERLRTEVVNLADSRHLLVAQLKAALGRTTDQPDPPVPVRMDSTSLDLTPEQLLSIALAHNPRLKQMKAEVGMAEAGIQLARRSRYPDFGAGLEANVKASPVMWRPSLAVSLPIWRDKIAAEIAAAQASKKASEARLTAEQIELAVDLADKSLMYREATRNVLLYGESLVPKARLALEVARAGYTTGRTGFTDLLDAERTLLEFQVSELEARTARELSLSELSLLIVAAPPPGAPFVQTSRSE